MRSAELVDREIEPAALVAAARDPRSAAVSLFIGTVPDVNGGRGVSAIDYSAYVAMAQEEMEQIVAEAADRFGVGAIAVEHRLGALALGEVSVAIAAAHEH